MKQSVMKVLSFSEGTGSWELLNENSTSHSTQAVGIVSLSPLVLFISELEAHFPSLQTKKKKKKGIEERRE